MLHYLIIQLKVSSVKTDIRKGLIHTNVIYFLATN